jgi:hypothetical protein
MFLPVSDFEETKDKYTKKFEEIQGNLTEEFNHEPEPSSTYMKMVN